jgi:hypothetical protein
MGNVGIAHSSGSITFWDGMGRDLGGLAAFNPISLEVEGFWPIAAGSPELAQSSSITNWDGLRSSTF